MSTELLYKLKIPNTLRQLHERVKQKRLPKPNSNLVTAIRNYERLRQQARNLVKSKNINVNIGLAFTELKRFPGLYAHVLHPDPAVVYQRISALPRYVPKNNKMMHYQSLYARKIALNEAIQAIKQPYVNAGRRLIHVAAVFPGFVNSPNLHNLEIHKIANLALRKVKVNKGRLIRNTYRQQKYAPNTALGRARLAKMFEGSPPRAPASAPATKRRRRA
jgi:hypothetical protein